MQECVVVKLERCPVTPMGEKCQDKLFIVSPVRDWLLQRTQRSEVG
jgi:hypothetical protein